MKISRTLALTALLALPALAGLPILCEPVEIGGAASLPWSNGQPDPRYPTAQLSTDTLRLLAAETPVPVRMETLRRAAMYGAGDRAAASELAARLMARVLAAETAGSPDGFAWFDAGYFIEAYRMAHISKNWQTIPDAERKNWDKPGGPLPFDGYLWVRQAVRRGAKGLEPAIARMERYRKSNFSATFPRRPGLAQ